MMAEDMEDMNKWGGEVVHCVGCAAHTPTPSFVGRLKCCKLRVGLCQECTTRLPELGFETPRHAVGSWAKEHAENCSHLDIDLESEKWAPKARELYQLLGTTLHNFNAEAGLPVPATETALILLCRTFCNTTGLPLREFSENFLTGYEEAQTAAKKQPAVKAESKPDTGLN